MSTPHGQRKRIRVVHRWLAALVAAAVAAQFFLAGAGAFYATSFDPHTTLGWAIGVASLLVLLLALAAANERRASCLLVGVVAVQLALGVLGTESSAWFGALHGLNALAVLGAAGNLARRTAHADAAQTPRRIAATETPLGRES